MEDKDKWNSITEYVKGKDLKEAWSYLEKKIPLSGPMKKIQIPTFPPSIDTKTPASCYLLAYPSNSRTNSTHYLSLQVCDAKGTFYQAICICLQIKNSIPRDNLNIIKYESKFVEYFSTEGNISLQIFNKNQESNLSFLVTLNPSKKFYGVLILSSSEEYIFRVVGVPSKHITFHTYKSKNQYGLVEDSKNKFNLCSIENGTVLDSISQSFSNTVTNVSNSLTYISLSPISDPSTNSFYGGVPSYNNLPLSASSSFPPSYSLSSPVHPSDSNLFSPFPPPTPNSFSFLSTPPTPTPTTPTPPTPTPNSTPNFTPNPTSYPTPNYTPSPTLTPLCDSPSSVLPVNGISSEVIYRSNPNVSSYFPSPTSSHPSHSIFMNPSPTHTFSPNVTHSSVSCSYPNHNPSPPKSKKRKYIKVYMDESSSIDPSEVNSQIVLSTSNLNMKMGILLAKLAGNNFTNECKDSLVLLNQLFDSLSKNADDIHFLNRSLQACINCIQRRSLGSIPTNSLSKTPSKQPLDPEEKCSEDFPIVQMLERESITLLIHFLVAVDLSIGIHGNNEETRNETKEEEFNELIELLNEHHWIEKTKEHNDKVKVKLSEWIRNERYAEYLKKGMNILGKEILWPHPKQLLIPLEKSGFKLKSPTVRKPDRCVCDVCEKEKSNWRPWQNPFLFHDHQIHKKRNKVVPKIDIIESFILKQKKNSSSTLRIHISDSI